MDTGGERSQRLIQRTGGAAQNERLVPAPAGASGFLGGVQGHRRCGAASG